MLDIKLGGKTASIGWMGKSRLSTLSNRTVDNMTNSVTEGYRLEGLDNAPKTIKLYQTFFNKLKFF